MKISITKTISSIAQLNQRYLRLPLPLRLLVVVSIFCLLIIGTQNLQFFPGAVMAIFNRAPRPVKSLPSGVTSETVITSDQQRLEVWRLPATKHRQIAVIFHGNAGDVENFFVYQDFFKNLGITSYGFDYRGYGVSTGWPSEKGLYLDGAAVVEYILKREQIPPADLIIVGVSIGAGPAAQVARQIGPGMLLLFSPYIDLPSVVKAQPIYGVLHRFTMYKFPVMENVKNLKQSCLIVAHGKRDNVIPYEQGVAVFEAFNSERFSALIVDEEASHNDILFESYREVQEKIFKCFPYSFSPQ